MWNMSFLPQGDYESCLVPHEAKKDWLPVYKITLIFCVVQSIDQCTWDDLIVHLFYTFPILSLNGLNDDSEMSKPPRHYIWRAEEYEELT